MANSAADSYCGIDFGTTNSSLSIVKNGRPVVVPIDPENQNPHILKSLIYINPRHEASVGSLAKNIGAGKSCAGQN